MKKINEGLICTNDNCVGCNKCISVCSCPGATIATESSDGGNIIKVDATKCIACGACLDACEHNAREYIDDTDRLIHDLKNGEDISILVAPAFFANYPDEYKLILGKLKSLGVNKILSVAFGADITTWAYLKYISEHNFSGTISQPCPAVVDYIERYIPELIPKLIPVQSPMLCMAIYARKYLDVTGKMAFLGPCIAKKNEINSKRGKGLISYSVTFDHFVKRIRDYNIETESYYAEDYSGLGAVYPMSGGLKENVRWFLGQEAFVRQVEGEKKLYEYLQRNKNRILQEDSPYTLIDVLNCTDGCLCGTGVEDVNDSREDTLIQVARIRESSRCIKQDSPWASDFSHEKRLEKLNEQFSDLDLEDYLCEYEDKSEKCGWKTPSEEELSLVFEDMNKHNWESRCINCSSCGYNSCKDMAEAIYNGFNHKENCIHFIKDVLEDISADYPTVVLIHEDTQAIHVVKYTGEDSIRGWIESGLGRVDYNTAIYDYIDRYVDDEDKERVRSVVEFNELQRRLSETNHFAVVYTRHPEKGNSGFFRMNFTRITGQNDILLSFQDVDTFIKESNVARENLKKALEEAEQANKAKTTFLANMSHEIRTPINAILGMDTMILRESNQENVLEYARNVKSASNTLLSLINDILDFSKIESGKMEIVNGKYRLDSVINDLMNMVRGKAEEKGLQLDLKMQSDIPAQLIGDEVRIKQVILNILNNAVKYTQKGTVTFSISYEQKKSDSVDLIIEIKDTGIGIKKENMKVLFSPYERIEEDRNKLIEGTGLGLSITRNLLEKMGSKLKVNSVYGEGSSFSFKVTQRLWGQDRISIEHLSLSDKSQEEEKTELFHAPDANILAVDDVEMNITVLVSLLKRSMIKLDSCLSGKEALELAENKKYDIIFLDAMMPGMSGEETLFEIRKNCRINDDTPIIVLTANAIVGAREKYIEEGFTDYLSKPIDGNKLEKLVRKYLPKEKVVKVTRSNHFQEKSDDSKKNDPCLNALKTIDEISVVNGISAAGGEETYLSVCRNFYDTANNRIGMIREYFDADDISNYTIQVHALKSSARLIGADALSDFALKMEMAGKDNDVQLIKAKTAELLDHYEKIVDKLGTAFNSLENKKDKKELTVKKFKRRMSELLELMEAFDFESSKELFGEFDEYQIPQECEQAYETVKAYMADVSRDEVIEFLQEYLRKGTNA